MFGFGKRPANAPEQAAQSAVPAPASGQGASAESGEKQGFFGRLLAGLSRTRETLAEGLDTLLLGKTRRTRNAPVERRCRHQGHERDPH
jgi:hypothetical protein